MTNQKFFKFDIKRHVDDVVEREWRTIDTVCMEVPELADAQSEKEATEILKVVFPDAGIRNLRELTDEEVKDILY